MLIFRRPQALNVILDTGSADFWVATTPCTTCASDTPLFDSSKSSTYGQVDLIQNITYGLGDVNGTVSTDTVTFSGFTIPSQEFRACISVT